MKKKLSKNFGKLKGVDYDCGDPEDDWLAHFNKFLDNTDHIVSKCGKFYMVSKGKKKRITDVNKQ